MAVSSIGRASSSRTTYPLPCFFPGSVVELEGSRFESWTALAPTNEAGDFPGLHNIIYVYRVDRFGVDSLSGVTYHS